MLVYVSDNISDTQHNKTWGVALHIGAVQSGFARQIVVEVDVPPLADRKNGVYLEVSNLSCR
jgi:hypothetical protein